ncbi:hypothetical protein GN958_ATG03271 [Phytophthora infestans]|uniref:Uncharacterized protein n=1 Tax=Phytophthora infestans TaxID=4787 RepID=A0A8S9V3S6_PHYIN|nr:hypothetical protein GN958_ATG03271 [Phytophthora infestans]
MTSARILGEYTALCPSTTRCFALFETSTRDKLPLARKNLIGLSYQSKREENYEICIASKGLT